MARFGTNFDDVQGEFGGQAALPDVGVQDFEITKVTSSVQGKGKNVGAPYVSARCAQVSGENPGTKAMSQFLGLGTVPFANGSCQKAQTKGFLEAIGRDDLLHPDGDPGMLVGTTFRARVYHDTDQNGRVQANITDVEAISHAQSNPANAPANVPAQQPATAPTQQQQAVAQPPQAPPAAAPATRRRAR